MPDRVRALLSEGYSKEACAGAIGVSVSRFQLWQKEKKEFREAIKEGEALSQKWWEDRGREACANGEFNATVWVMQMKNRFGWRDAKQLDSKVDITTKSESISETEAWISSVFGGDEETKDSGTRTH